MTKVCFTCTTTLRRLDTILPPSFLGTSYMPGRVDRGCRFPPFKESRLHHQNAAELKASVDHGCYICDQLWASMASLGFDGALTDHTGAPRSLDYRCAASWWSFPGTERELEIIIVFVGHGNSKFVNNCFRTVPRKSMFERFRDHRPTSPH